jgi:hypothetical protein
MVESWQELAKSSCQKQSQEKDTVKLRFLINQLIHALSQEQKQLRMEIEERIKRHVRDMEKKGLDSSIP